MYLIYNVKEFAADVRGCLLSYRSDETKGKGKKKSEKKKDIDLS